MTDLHPEIPIPRSPAMVVIPDAGDDMPPREEKQADSNGDDSDVEYIAPPHGENHGKRKPKAKAKGKSKKAKVTKCMDIVIPEGCEDFRVFLSFGGYDWIAEWHDDGSVPEILPIFTKRVGPHDAR